MVEKGTGECPLVLAKFPLGLWRFEYPACFKGGLYYKFAQTWSTRVKGREGLKAVRNQDQKK